MKGKTTFTKAEIAEIESLIKQKLNADSTQQKAIRNRIRRIGFYWTDFPTKGEYNVENFRALIATGAINVI